MTEELEETIIEPVNEVKRNRLKGLALLLIIFIIFPILGYFIYKKQTAEPLVNFDDVTQIVYYYDSGTVGTPLRQQYTLTLDWDKITRSVTIENKADIVSEKQITLAQFREVVAKLEELEYKKGEYRSCETKRGKHTAIVLVAPNKESVFIPKYDCSLIEGSIIEADISRVSEYIENLYTTQ